MCQRWGPFSGSQGGGADGGPGHVGLSEVELHSVHIQELHKLACLGTDWTGVVSMFAFAFLCCSCSSVLPAPRFVVSERVCESSKSKSVTERSKPHTPCTLARSAQEQREQNQARKHSPHTTSHLPTLPPHPPRNPSSKKKLSTQTGNRFTASTFANQRHPFHFSLNLPVSTLVLLFFGSRPHFLHLFGFTVYVLPQPTTGKVLLVHGFVFSD